jgi:penicillin-binding protein 1C
MDPDVARVAHQAPLPDEPAVEAAVEAGRGARLSRWLRRWLLATAAIVMGGVALPMVALEVASRMAPPLPMERASALSTTVLDRHGILLRAYVSRDGHWRLPIVKRDVDPHYLDMLLAFEDRRFYRHIGIDPAGVIRSIWHIVWYGRPRSGGSTLTMQVARLLDGHHEKTAAGKWRQMARARQIERQFSKDQILELYLKLAPFGGNIEGVRAASLAYFGKEPRRLSLAETALLVALPQSPAARRPDRSPEAAKRGRDRVLVAAARAGIIKSDEARAARNEPVPATRRDFPRLAPHLADSEVEAEPTQSIVRTTLDARAQAALEKVATDHAALGGVGLSAAIIAVDHRTGDVLAHVGSAGFLEETRGGAIDMARALRSPGSTLKPVIYGLAFDLGLAHPETLIEDRPTRFGSYMPKNFDHDFHGIVSIRAALAQSLNIPAVKVLDAVGPGRLINKFQQIGLTPQLPTGAEPTLAIALGGLGMTLRDLAQLYATLARGGEAIAIRHRTHSVYATGAIEAARSPQRLMSPVSAWYVADILKNAPPPANARGGQIAFKTGTSYGYRDAWSVGFDGRYTVAAWIGRPDGASVPGLNGRSVAAPLLFDAFQRLGEHRVLFAAAPDGAIRLANSGLPRPLQTFQDKVLDSRRDVAEAGPYRSAPVHIAFPQNQSELEFEMSDTGGEQEPIVVKAEGGQLPLTWMVDGAPVPSDPARREASLTKTGRGFIKLSVIDALGRTDRVTVRVK